jgi:quercetin 2,3-dioxygenase
MTQAWWLQSVHSFSFGQYYDPDRMGFGPLRVINDDVIAGWSGFPPHPHRDMEIISIPLSGWLMHEDSLGNKTTIWPDMVQVMSAGSGIAHAEYNAYSDQSTTFLQIWIEPHTRGVAPRHVEQVINYHDGKPIVIASPDAHDGSIMIHQDLTLSRVRSSHSMIISQELEQWRGIYLFVISGSLTTTIDGQSQLLEARDALSLVWSTHYELELSSDSDVLLFDMKME